MRAGDARTPVMASAAAKGTSAERSPPKARPISEIGLTPAAARELRARLASFAREWDDPRMDVYDAEP